MLSNRAMPGERTIFERVTLPLRSMISTGMFTSACGPETYTSVPSSDTETSAPPLGGGAA